RAAARTCTALREVKYRIECSDGAAIAVADGRIIGVETSSDCSVHAAGHARPGFINAHDHLQRNHYPRLGRPPYRDSYEWGRDIHAQFGDVIERCRKLDRRTAPL